MLKYKRKVFGEDAFTDYISADVKLNTNLATEMIMLCTVALNVLIFQNCKMVDSLSSSDEIMRMV